METPPQTQITSGSQRNYLWIILFAFDVDNESPFTCLSLDHFKGTDFPWHLISGHLGPSDRMKPRQLSALPGPKYAVFAKVESGKVKIYFVLYFAGNYALSKKETKYTFTKYFVF